MYSVDDTFRVLRKLPYSDLRRVIMDMPDEEWHSLTDEKRDEWFDQRGWTYHEYVRMAVRKQG